MINILTVKKSWKIPIQKKANGIRIRSKCIWYKSGEKSSKFFLNLEKTCAKQGHLRKILVNENEIQGQREVDTHLYLFFKNLFTQKLSVCEENVTKFPDQISLPKLNIEQISECEGFINEEELFSALKSMENDKSPGNDGLTKEFYETFWQDLKTPLLKSIRHSYLIDKLTVSQNQAVIKLIEKKDRDKRFIKNWHPISLLNVDAERVKNVIPSLVLNNQIAYVNNSFISEGGRLISDILEMTKSLQIDGILMTVDIEKAFDSVNHVFLISVLEKFSFGKNFVKWIKILLKNQESCVINGGKTSRYFQLKRGTRQGYTISPYLFILVLEVVFALIKLNKKIEGLNILNNTFLYTAYADDTTFFVKNENSVVEIVNTFDYFSLYSGLKINRSKCEIAGIGSKKGVNMALCGMRNVNLTNDTIKSLGISYSYNEKLAHEKNFMNYIIRIHSILKIWGTRNLTLEGKINIFKTLAFSKIIHLALVANVPASFVDLLKNIQKEFLWSGKKPKIKHDTIRNEYDNGGLKSVHIIAKIVSLQCTWIRRLFDNNFISGKLYLLV